MHIGIDSPDIYFKVHSDYMSISSLFDVRHIDYHAPKAILYKQKVKRQSTELTYFKGRRIDYMQRSCAFSYVYKQVNVPNPAMFYTNAKRTYQNKEYKCQNIQGKLN